MKFRPTVLSQLRRGRGPGCGYRAAGAMTLVEILVVMGIILTLATALSVAVFGLITKGQRKGTEALLEQLAIALAQYKNDHRMYVPCDGDSADPDGLKSTYCLWQALEQEGKYLSVSNKDKIKGDTYYEDPDTSAITPQYLYRDGWKTVVKYECHTPYSWFRLSSAGPDLDITADADNIVKE